MNKLSTLIVSVATMSVISGAGITYAAVKFLQSPSHHHTSQVNRKPGTSTNQPKSKSASSVTVTLGTPVPVNSSKRNVVYTVASQCVKQPPAAHFDASAFIQYVYSKAGVTLPRTIQDQSQTGTRIPSKAGLMTGDLVFFSEQPPGDTVTFVGIYIGGGHAVALTSHGYDVIDITKGYWADKFKWGTRVL